MSVSRLLIGIAFFVVNFWQKGGDGTGDKKMHNIINKSRAARTIKSGFTLIEMLIVVLIVAILAAIALPQYNISVERTKMTEAVTLTKQIAEANKRYYMATGAYANSISELDIDISGEDYNNNGNIRKQTENFIYTASAGQNYLAITQRVPIGQRYVIAISRTNDRAFCSTIYATATDIQKKLCAQLNAEGTI